MPAEAWNTILSVVLLSVMGSVAWLWQKVIDHGQQISAINEALDLPAIKADVEAVHSRVTKVAGEVSNLEGQLKAINVAKLSESVNKVAGQLGALDRQVHMINQHLLDKPK